MKDIFFCYVTEDTSAVVRPVVDRLRSDGLEVSFEEFSLNREQPLDVLIESGLRGHRYGVVVLSPGFFRLSPSQTQLAALFYGVLPLWHEVDRADVSRHFPMLAYRFALHTREGLENVADALTGALRPSPQHPIEDVLWLQMALGVYDSESSLARQRWVFHLKAATRAARHGVRIEEGVHYEVADRLCRLGFLSELSDYVPRSPGSRHRSHKFFRITDKGRIMLEVLRSRERDYGSPQQ